MTPEAVPMLKWVGGKRRLLPEILPRLGEVPGGYVEAFVGGGALFFALRAAGRLHGAVTLGDGNLRLIRTYRAVQTDVEGVIRRYGVLRGAEQSRRQYEIVRAAPPDRGPDTGVAAWMLYLNRAGFNGLYRVNRRGEFNVPWGQELELPDLSDNLRACSVALTGVTLLHGDFAATAAQSQPGDVVYFDPPYLDAGTFTSYGGTFAEAEHARLADLAVDLARTGRRVLLSNADSPEVARVYAADRFDRDHVTVRRSVAATGSKRVRVGEVLLTPRAVRSEPEVSDSAVSSTWDPLFDVIMARLLGAAPFDNLRHMA